MSRYMTYGISIFSMRKGHCENMTMAMTIIKAAQSISVNPYNKELTVRLLELTVFLFF